LQHLNGLLRPQRGSVQIGELRLEDARTTTREVVKRAGLVFQNPEMQFFETYVGDEIAYGPRQLALQGPVREHVRRAMELVGLDFEAFKDRPVFELSGGERRKVALASVLANRTEILLLDEPTAGLDPQSHRDILARLRHLQSEGTQLMISSHRMDDLAEMAQDLTVFRKGLSLFSGPAADFFGRAEELYEAGLEPPTAVRAALRLRELGWPVPESVVNADQLEASLSNCGGGRQ
jgi:energy-coupling factor transport system ATP-binding protein